MIDPAEARAFTLGQVLTLTDGHLLCTMDELYDIMGYVTGDPGITTIGLAMMADTAKDHVRAQLPELADIKVEDGQITSAQEAEVFLNQQVQAYGLMHYVRPLNTPEPVSLDEQIDYVMECNPNAQFIGVVVPDEE